MSNNNKILIVDATGSEKGKRRFTRDAIGCGVRSICGVLEQLGIESKIILAEDALEKGFPKGFSSLFISAMSMDKIAVKRLVQNWRKISRAKIVLGGPITSELEATLISTRVDIIVIGEGEKAIKELIDSEFLSRENGYNKLKDIKGIGFTDERGKIAINSPRNYSTELEFQIFKPSTKRIQDYSNYFSAKVYVECVRGCSNFKGTKIKLLDGRQCSGCGFCESESLEDRLKCPENIPPGCGFCSVPNLFGPSRSRKTDDIIQEIQELLYLGVKRIILSAPDFLDFARDKITTQKPLINPTYPPANIKEIEFLLEQISNLNQVTKRKAWIEVENIKAHLFTEEVAKTIAKYLPGSSFSIGCETGSEEHARLLGRPSMPKETLQAVKLAHQYGLKAHVYFIHSLPGQTNDTVNETLKLMTKLEPFIDKITIYRFRPLPMSAFGDFPPPEPAIKNPESKKISELANNINLRKKKELIGTIVKAIISEPNYHDVNGAMANILSGGPIIALENARERIGEIVTVKIIKAISEKLVLGEIISEEWIS